MGSSFKARNYLLKIKPGLVALRQGKHRCCKHVVEQNAVNDTATCAGISGGTECANNTKKAFVTQKGLRYVGTSFAHLETKVLSPWVLFLFPRLKKMFASTEYKSRGFLSAKFISVFNRCKTKTSYLLLEIGKKCYKMRFGKKRGILKVCDKIILIKRSS